MNHWEKHNRPSAGRERFMGLDLAKPGTERTTWFPIFPGEIFQGWASYQAKTIDLTKQPDGSYA